MPAQSRGNRIFFLSIPLNPPMFLEPLSLFASGRKRLQHTLRLHCAVCCIMNQLNVSSYSELNRYRFVLSVRQFPSFSNCSQHTWHPREEDNRMSPRTHTENEPILHNIFHFESLPTAFLPLLTFQLCQTN